MKSSLFVKNLFMTVSLLLLCVVLVGGVSSVWTYRYISRTERDKVAAAAETAAHTVSALSGEYEAGSMEMQMNVSMLGKASGYRVLVADSSGTVTSCSDGLTCMHIGMPLPGEMISAVDVSGSFRGPSALSPEEQGHRYVYALPLTDSTGTGIGYLAVSADSSKLTETWRESAGRLVMVAIVVMIIAVPVSLFMTMRTTKPIREMTDTVDRFARGDYSARVDIPFDDELGQLADSFNLMADTLERQEKQRSEFIANVSHELKTPMTTISGFADGILDGTIPREKADEYLAVISSETHRLSRLVRSMLDVSSLSAKDPEIIRSQSFDLTDVICQTLLSLEKRILERDLDVDADLPEEPIHALGDRDAITQVVYNLLDNAAKFADPGTVIRISLWKRNDRAYVSVADRGPTIPEEELPLIFDRFHKSDKSRSMDKTGVGLGLYLVKTILDNHHEDIAVTSVDGLTTFTFTLTVASQKQIQGRG
ncbi:MAG: HAMP domain-containing histidine kinase [Oscillospiraceae bacterium]|nr:HAMP domain-containing histidine kinase [Oscillospiraceae bacterium]